MQNEISFEESIQKLDEIVAELENGNLPLNKLKEKISESKTLIENCKNQLREVPAIIEDLKSIVD